MRVQQAVKNYFSVSTYLFHPEQLNTDLENGNEAAQYVMKNWYKFTAVIFDVQKDGTLKGKCAGVIYLRPTGQKVTKKEQLFRKAFSLSNDGKLQGVKVPPQSF